MDRESMLKSYIMKAAIQAELMMSEIDVVPLEFGAKTDLSIGIYYDIQYVIFLRISKQSIWKCSTIGENEYHFEIVQINQDENGVTGYIE